ncbi:hypothetical protein GGI22_002588 [Coemansia erecta]|nr:hypothetical protein GGI22_002588 [Coemansia erecta]
MDHLTKRLREIYPPGLITHRDIDGQGFPMDTDALLLSSRIRTLPNWINDRQSARKRREWHGWGKEAGLTDSDITYMLDELDYYACVGKSEIGIEAGCFDMIWISKVLVDNELYTKLAQQLDGFKKLTLRQSRHRQTATPATVEGRGSSVLDVIGLPEDLLDYDKTRVLQDARIRSLEDAIEYIGHGKRLSSTKQWEHAYRDLGYEFKIDWMALDSYVGWKSTARLPSEVHVDRAGNATFSTYISNVHPVEHRELYTTLGRVLTKATPLFEEVLTDMVYPPRLRMLKDPGYGDDVRPEVPEIANITDEFVSEYSKWYHTTKYVPTPRSGAFEMPERPPMPLSLKDRRLQVAVDAAEYTVPPKTVHMCQISQLDREFNSPNERIIATAELYYGFENILHVSQEYSVFLDIERHMYNHEFDLMPDLVYPGLEIDDDLDQDDIYSRLDIDRSLEPPRAIGTQIVTDGMCVCFSSLYSSINSDIQLVDKGRPGKIKVLRFYLVDPATRVVSTEMVPPQQHPEWILTKVFGHAWFSRLPTLILNRIRQFFVAWTEPEQEKSIYDGMNILNNAF